MKPLIRPLIAATVLMLVPALRAQSAWLPAEKKFEVTPLYVYQTFDEFWIKRGHRIVLPDTVDQQSATVSVEYGITTQLALDATVGYTRVDSSTCGKGATDDGFTDSRLGVRYSILDEHATSNDWVPTVTLRAGAIIAGTYNEGRPFSAGDGAHGAEFSALVGKTLGGTGFGVFSELGYRVRENPVPDDLFASVGVYKTLGSFTLSTVYRHVQSLSGLDIMDPGFTFPQLKEINQLLEAGVGYQDKGGRFYQLFVARSIAG